MILLETIQLSNHHRTTHDKAKTQRVDSQVMPYIKKPTKSGNMLQFVVCLRGSPTTTQFKGISLLFSS